MGFDLISLLIILVLATLLVLTMAESPLRRKLCDIGGLAFLIWAAVRLVAFLVSRGGAS
jgi:hypothetical protein